MGKKNESKRKLQKSSSALAAPSRHPTTRTISIKSKSASYEAVSRHGTDTEDTKDDTASMQYSIKTLPNSIKSKRESKVDSLEEIELEKKPSPVRAPLPRLTEAEYRFFRKVEAGNLESVEEILKAGKININKTNREGYTVLHVAVRRQDEPMVKLLLSRKDIYIYDTILHAIREENISLTNILLEAYDKQDLEENQISVDSPSKEPLVAESTPRVLASAPSGSAIKTTVTVKIPNQSPTPSRSSSSKSRSKVASLASSRVSQDFNPDPFEVDVPFDSEFHSVITPLMLAATVGNVSLMEIFYQRGERLETEQYPHNKNCECDICSKLEGDQDMTRAHQRFHLFKSITKPEYICFLARKEKIDPIKYSISKIIKLRELNDKDDAFFKQYEEPMENLEEFIAKMADLCRTSQEAEMFMSPKDSDTEVLPHLYPRLWYSVGHDLKKLVTNKNIQNLVYKIWATDDWPEWDTYGEKYRVIQAISRMIFPIGILYNFLSLRGKANGWSSPLSRFLNYVGCYFYFLAYLAFQTTFPYQRCNNNEDKPKYQVDDKHCTERGPPNIGTEWVLVVFVVSFYISLIKRQSVLWFWKVKWNWFELAMVISLTLVLVCWGWSWLWTQMPENEDLIFSTERLMWPHDSPEILAECFLSLSCLFCFGKVLRFLQVFPIIGPIQVSLGTQIVAFLNTICILGVFIFSAATGLLAIFVPYKGFEGIDDEGKRKTQDEGFTDLWPTFQNLFWHLYGMGDSHGVATLLKWDTAGSDENGTQELNEHTLTVMTGTGIYCFYHFVASMIMWAMLSAYFTQSISAITDDVDTFWKFSRTELYLTFIKDTMLPPPFNWIPTVKTMKIVLTGKICKLMKRKEDPRCMCSLRQCCYFTQGKKRDRWRTLMKGYRKLIVELMLRYSNFKEDEDENEKATRDDFKEIGEELDEIIAFLGKTKKGSRISPDEDGDDSPSPPPSRAGGTNQSKSGKWDVPKSTLEFYGSEYFKEKTAAPSQMGQNVPKSTFDFSSSEYLKDKTVASSQAGHHVPKSTLEFSGSEYLKDKTVAPSQAGQNVPKSTLEFYESDYQKDKTAAPSQASQNVPKSTLEFYDSEYLKDKTGGASQMSPNAPSQSQSQSAAPSKPMEMSKAASSTMMATSKYPTTAGNTNNPSVTDGNNYFEMPSVSRHNNVGIIDFTGVSTAVVPKQTTLQSQQRNLGSPSQYAEGDDGKSYNSTLPSTQQVSSVKTKDFTGAGDGSGPVGQRNEPSGQYSTQSRPPAPSQMQSKSQKSRSPMTKGPLPTQQLSTRGQKSTPTMPQSSPQFARKTPLSAPVVPPPPLAQSIDGDSETTNRTSTMPSQGTSRRRNDSNWNWA